MAKGEATVPTSVHPPPKKIRREVRHLQHPDEPDFLSGSLMLMESDDAALRLRDPYGLEGTPESLPVLRAFQQFLEGERRHTRNRMLFLTMFFAAVLIAVVAGGVFIATVFMGQIRGDVDGLHSDISDIRGRTEKTEGATAALLSGLEEEAAKLREGIRKDREGLSGISDTLDARLAGYSSALQGLEGIMETLRLENATLKGEMGEMRRMWREAPPSPAPPGIATTMSGPILPETLTMSITPRGTERTYQWRIPLPGE